MWHSLLTSLAASDIVGSNSLKNLLEVAQTKRLPRYLKPEETELDGVVAHLLEKAIGGSEDEVLLFRQLLVNSGGFFSLYVFNFLIGFKDISYRIWDTNPSWKVSHPPSPPVSNCSSTGKPSKCLNLA